MTDRRAPEDLINTLTEERDSLCELLSVEQQRSVILTKMLWYIAFVAGGDETADPQLSVDRLREQLDATQTPCTWTEDLDGLWESKCTDHGPFQFFDGGPADNHVAFCPYCGHPLMAVAYIDTLDTEAE